MLVSLPSRYPLSRYPPPAIHTISTGIFTHFNWIIPSRLSYPECIRVKIPIDIGRSDGCGQTISRTTCSARDLRQPMWTRQTPLTLRVFVYVQLTSIHRKRLSKRIPPEPPPTWIHHLGAMISWFTQCTYINYPSIGGYLEKTPKTPTYGLNLNDQVSTHFYTTRFGYVART